MSSELKTQLNTLCLHFQSPQYFILFKIIIYFINVFHQHIFLFHPCIELWPNPISGAFCVVHGFINRQETGRLWPVGSHCMAHCTAVEAENHNIAIVQQNSASQTDDWLASYYLLQFMFLYVHTTKARRVHVSWYWYQSRVNTTEPD